MSKKYHIITYGCQMNKSDSERIAALLEEKGYQPAANESVADLVVFNICSVRQSAINRAYNKISNLLSKKPTIVGFLDRRKKNDRKIFLTGCVLEADKKNFEKLGVKIKKFRALEKIKPATGFVPIMQGCDNFCTYCVVPYTRGREKCRSPQEIICEIKHLIKNRVKEITLLGQNVNSYKYNLKAACERRPIVNYASKLKAQKIIDFADLLKIINDLSGNFTIRFLTNHPKDMTDKLIDAIASCDKLVKYIHLPVQSGDNEILRKMNRSYTREQYLALVKKIKNKIPNVELTTDVIVGFPGETKKAFENTVALLKTVQFSNAFIGKYSPRPGTAAYRLPDDVPAEEKKRREQILRCLL